MPQASQAKLKKGVHGDVPEGEGWFVTNLSKASWLEHKKFGGGCRFEGDARFPHFGINVRVLMPGQPNCHYHLEGEQEDFLVLQGEAKVIVEGEEIPLKTWDFVHCPAGTRHVFVGAGKGPCVILMVGSRTGGNLHYPVDPAAAKWKACAPVETDSRDVSYKDCGTWEPAAPKWPPK